MTDTRTITREDLAEALLAVHDLHTIRIAEFMSADEAVDAIFAALPAAEEPPSDFGEQSAAHGQRLPKSVQRAIDKMSVPASPAPEGLRQADRSVYVYLTLKEAPAAKTSVYKPGRVMFDYDGLGQLIGIEVLDAFAVDIDGQEVLAPAALTAHPDPQEVGE
jgi:hypothetical protein